jgi:hypothetical protein
MGHSQQYGMTDVVWTCGKENDRVYTMLSRKAHLEDGYVLQCEAPRRYFLQVVQQARRALQLSPRGVAAIVSQHLHVLSACLVCMSCLHVLSTCLESAFLRMLLRMKS